MIAMDQERAYDFVEQPSPELFCCVSSALLLEPYLTECCGSHISQETYRRLNGSGWCTVCGGYLSAVLDKSVKRKVLSLKVRCPHKADGCEWEGALDSLDQHLNVNSSAGECRYVDVDCPYACGERVQRRNAEEHMSQHCPLRPFSCQYCNHRATHLKVTKEHWPGCVKYPLPCPNECGEEEIERQHLKEHLEQTCPLQVIQCEIGYAGCNAQLQRRQMPAHMKENVETHLSLVGKEVPKLQNIVQQQADLIKQMASQMKQQEDHIKQQEEQVKRAFMQLQQGKPFPPMDIIMDDFEKRKKSCVSWYSPPFYTHIGGYKMRLKVDAQGCLDGKGTHVSLSVYLMKGEFNNLLKWPFRGKIIIQLKNPSFVYQQILALNDDTPNEQVCKPSKEWNDHGPGNSKYISHDDLYSGGYLKDNKLVFCVCFSDL